LRISNTVAIKLSFTIAASIERIEFDIVSCIMNRNQGIPSLDKDLNDS